MLIVGIYFLIYTVIVAIYADYSTISQPSTGKEQAAGEPPKWQNTRGLLYLHMLAMYAISALTIAMVSVTPDSAVNNFDFRTSRTEKMSSPATSLLS